MIQFFVNKKEIVLPDDFAFTWNEENPEITSIGEFSLDMEFSLLEAPNAIAFKFLNRKNKTDIDKTADATMIDNGRVYIGTFIISKNTDLSVIGQFVAGNSEFKYLAKNENKIWSLNFGTELAIDYTKALFTINNPGYAHSNFVCTPVMVGASVFNRYTLNGNTPTTTDGQIGAVQQIVMQPYLLYFINKLPELLGYALVNNVLNENARANKMFCVNAIKSLNYSDCLPDWTVTEFVENIQTFFNVSFLVDSRNKTMRIETLASNFDNKKVVKIDKILKSFERDLSQDSKTVRFDFTKVSYNLSTNGLWKYQKIDDSIVAKTEIVPFTNEAALLSNVFDASWLGKYKLYRDSQRNYDYAFVDAPTSNVYYRKTNVAGKFIYLVNKFRSWGTSSDKELIFKVVPAEMTQAIVRSNYSVIGQPNIETVQYYQLPKSSISTVIDTTSVDFLTAIQSGETVIDRTSNLEVALFTGKITLANLDNDSPYFPAVLYPFSHVDYFPEYGFIGNETSAYYPYANNWTKWLQWRDNHFIPAATETLRLIGTNGVVEDYRQATIIDTSKEYTFTFPDGPDISANNIFDIDNLKYMPISLQRQKSNKETPVLGKFYQMLIQ